MSETTRQLALGKQKMSRDLGDLLIDSREMLRLASNVPGEGIEVLRSRLSAHVESLRNVLGERQDAVQRHYRVAAVDTRRYVRRNPWRSIGIAASVGFMLGVLAAR